MFTTVLQNFFFMKEAIALVNIEMSVVSETSEKTTWEPLRYAADKVYNPLLFKFAFSGL